MSPLRSGDARGDVFELAALIDSRPLTPACVWPTWVRGGGRKEKGQLDGCGGVSGEGRNG